MNIGPHAPLGAAAFSPKGALFVPGGPAMKKVTIKYFASIREALGQGSETVDTQADTLQTLRDELLARGGTYGATLARGKAVRMALNHVMCDESTVLTEGAEVAFFPPVTGG